MKNSPKEAAATPLPTMNLKEALVTVDGEQTELDKIIELLLDPRNISHNTELTRNEITAFSVLATLAKRHNLPVLKDFIRENLIFRVSKNRAGRKEITKIVSRQLAQSPQDGQDAGGFGSRWFGRRR